MDGLRSSLLYVGNDMSEWQIEGEKSIPCTPPLSEIPVPNIDFSQFQVPDPGLWVPNVWQNFSGALGR